MNQFSFDDSQYRKFMPQYEEAMHQYHELLYQYQLKVGQYQFKPTTTDDLSWLEPKTKVVLRDYEWVDNLVDSLEGGNNESIQF